MKAWNKYLKKQNGALLAVMGVIFLFTLGLLGTGVDLGMAYMQKEKLQNAADAGALAGAGQLWNSQLTKIDDTTTTLTNTLITKPYIAEFVNKNMGYNAVADTDSDSYAGNTTNVNIKATYAEDSSNTNIRTVTVELRKEMPTYFLRIFGFKTLPVEVIATAQNEKSGSSGGSNPFSYMFAAGDYDDGNINHDKEKIPSIYLESGKMHFVGGIRTNGKILSVHMPNKNAYTKVNGDIISSQSDAWVDDDGTLDTIGNHSVLTSQETMDISLEANNKANEFVNSIKSMSSSEREANHIYYGDSFTNAYVAKTSSGYNGMTKTYNKAYTVVVTDGDISTDTVNDFSSNYLGGDYIVLISLNGNVTVHNAGNLRAILYAPNGTVRVDGSGNQVFGSIVGRNIVATTEGTTFHYTSYLFGDNTSGSTSTTASISLIK